MLQATREAAAAGSDLHQGRLGTGNKEGSREGNCAEDKVDKERWKIKVRGQREEDSKPKQETKGQTGRKWEETERR